MVKGIPTFTNDLEEAVSFFRPILQRLSIRQETTGFPVFLSAFPQLWGQKNINKWVVTLLKTDLRGCRAKFMSQYHQQTGIMECYIILDNALFTASGIPNETRKAVAVHEFCHFVALIPCGPLVMNLPHLNKQGMIIFGSIVKTWI